MTNVKLLFSHSTKTNIIALVLFSFLIDGCFSSSRLKRNEIVRIDLSYTMPIMSFEGAVTNVADSFSVFYYNNLVLYKLPYYRTLEDGKNILLKERKYRYFVYRKNEKTGCYYDSIKIVNCQKMNVDSFISNAALGNFEQSNFYSTHNNSLVDTIKNDPDYLLIEKYLTINKIDMTYGDTTIFYYTDKLKNTNYSLSRQIEKVKKLRVGKVRVIYKSGYDTLYKVQFPYREFCFELKENSNTYDKDVFEILKKNFR